MSGAPKLIAPTRPCEGAAGELAHASRALWARSCAWSRHLRGLVAEQDVDLLGLAVALDGQGDLVAGRLAVDERRQLRGGVDPLTVDVGDDVAGLQARVIGGAAGGDRPDLRARRRRRVRAARGADPDAEPRVADGLAELEAGQHLAHGVGRD